MRLALLLLLSIPASAQFRAGVAKVNITPTPPVWLSGFAARTEPARTVSQPIWAKALAIKDARGGTFVLVTADLIGFTREITDEIAKRIAAKHKLERRQILFNASHTHSGPSVWPRLSVNPAESDAAIRPYADRLIVEISGAIDRAIESAKPANLAFSETTASFATNRRKEQLASIRPGETFAAPVDQAVPTFKITDLSGATLAIVFGYACHNTVLTGDTNEVNGDYAGYAQQELEARNPGAAALFITLCGGDQRPMPRGTRDLAEKHGKTLAASVQQALSKSKPVAGDLQTAYEVIRLPFQVHSRDVYLAESKSSDPFLSRRGRAMLEHPVTHTPYPVQVVRFGNGPVWVALGGEVVIDYQLKLKSEYGSKLTILGYSNDVMGYIPSRRVQREGGYEAGDSMVYFTQPGWFTEEVEELILGAVHRRLAELGLAARPSRGRRESTPRDRDQVHRDSRPIRGGIEGRPSKS